MKIARKELVQDYLIDKKCTQTTLNSFYFFEVKPKNRIQTVILFDENGVCSCIESFSLLALLGCLCCLYPCFTYVTLHNGILSRMRFEGRTKTCKTCGSNRKATEEDIHNYKVNLSEKMSCYCGCPNNKL